MEVTMKLRNHLDEAYRNKILMLLFGTSDVVFKNGNRNDFRPINISFTKQI